MISRSRQALAAPCSRLLACLASELGGDEAGVDAAAGEQLAVGALLGDTAVVEEAVVDEKV
jgi:hypothetical protein